MKLETSLFEEPKPEPPKEQLKEQPKEQPPASFDFDFNTKIISDSNFYIAIVWPSVRIENGSTCGHILLVSLMHEWLGRT